MTGDIREMEQPLRLRRALAELERRESGEEPQVAPTPRDRLR
jgi:hypothetical protein